MRLHRSGAASDMISARRRVRRSATADSRHAGVEFDVFAATWAEQYGFFDLKRADWKAIVAANQPRITGASPPEYAVRRDLPA